MFNINKIYTDLSGKRYLCDFHCDSIKKATYLVAGFLGPIRECYFLADLYAKGSTLILDTPNREATEKLAVLLNNSIKI